jgi:hypothetical protein
MITPNSHIEVLVISMFSCRKLDIPKSQQNEFARGSVDATNALYTTIH